MPLSIAIIAHIRHPIAEPYMGGMEAHSALLVRALRAAGHRVTLFAAAGSDDPDLVEICERPYEQVLPWARFRGTPLLGGFQQRAFRAAWERIAAGGFDVVHNNSLFAPLIDWAWTEGRAMLTSLHIPPFGALREAVLRGVIGAGQAFTVTSAAQLPLWFPAGAPANVSVAHNGIDTTRGSVQAQRGSHYLWAGRITPDKGTAAAAEAAHRARLPLCIVGQVEDRAYFDAMVAPWLGDMVRYLGHLGREELAREMSVARAVLVTPLWDEPFGLVAAEALAAGTPVVGFDRGAIAEVVGDCGLLVRGGDVGALASAMPRAAHIDAMRCRRRAERHFSLPAMVARYEAGYAAAMASASSRSSTVALLA